MRDSFDAELFCGSPILAAALILSGAVISLPAVSQNLLPDPTFRYGTIAGWQPFAPTNTVLSWNPDSRQPGSGSLMITPPSPFGGGAFLCVPAAAGQAYAWRSSVRGTGIFAGVSFYASTGCSGALLGERISPPAVFPTSEWLDLELIPSAFPAIAPPSTLTAKLLIADPGGTPLKLDELYFGPPGGAVLPVDVPALSTGSKLLLASCLGLAGVGALRAVGRC